jgi:hypothetical protein
MTDMKNEKFVLPNNSVIAGRHPSWLGGPNLFTVKRREDSSEVIRGSQTLLSADNSGSPT